ncbi:MAG: hypothetical protein PUC26_01580 [Eubacteriales bacterium]|nr:hypothetical protein [Eubacteriales bacterium]
MMKKRGRRILPLLLLVLVLVFGCCGCQSEVQDARQAVDDGMKQLQEGDLAEAADYFKGLDDIDKVLGTYESYGVDLEQLTGAMFGQMNYEITDAEKMKDNTVRVKVKITNKDMNKAADAWAEAIQKDAADPNSTLYKTYQKSSIKGVYKVLFEKLTKEISAEKDTVTENITVNVKKSGDQWKAVLSEAQLNKISGSFEDALLGVGSRFNI